SLRDKFCSHCLAGSLLAPQNHSWLSCAEQSQRKQRCQKRYGEAAYDNCRQDAESHCDRRLEVCMANPIGNSDTCGESDQSAGENQDGRFSGHEQCNQPVGSAECLHDCKVAAAIEHPSRKGCEYA